MMATLAQLESEPWWDREIVTVELDWLGDELCRRTGRPRVAAGTKGDRRHLRGSHRSQEWIKRSAFCSNRTYTVQGGLSPLQERYVAGFDFTPGSVEDMIAQSKRILAAMRAGRLNEVREFYGNVDGDQVVDGWDNVRDRAASSDSSHLWHWHAGIDRRYLTDKALMARIVAIALGIDEQEVPDMTPQQAQQLRDAHYTTAVAIPNPTGDGRVPLHVWAGWMTGAVKALATAVGNVDEATKAQLQQDLRALDASVQAVPGQVVDELGGVESDEEVASRLRALLGDRAAAVGAILATPRA
ncbi:MAG TPA: hypothetical protein VFT95_04150 [Micromonosporaceae bacterium]|nr:hypothetical protein [Micromonosporaceae bacterium]